MILWKKGRINNAVLSDINWDSINLYQVVKNDVDSLISELRQEDYLNDKEVFYDLREEFNDLKRIPIEPSVVISAIDNIWYQVPTCRYSNSMISGIYGSNTARESL